VMFFEKHNSVKELASVLYNQIIAFAIIVFVSEVMAI